MNIPDCLGRDDGKLTFVMDNVGEQESTAIGKNRAFAHLYLGDEIDEDFVRLFLSSPEGGKPREAWVFSNVANNYGSEIDMFAGAEVTLDGKVWSKIALPIMGTETIVTKDGEEITRQYNEFLMSRDIPNGTEFMLVRNISWADSDGDNHRAQRLFAGVSIPATCVS